MFRSETMYEVSIFALKEERSALIESLHTLGIMQFIDLKSKDRSNKLNLNSILYDESHKKPADFLLRISRLLNIMKISPMKLTSAQDLFDLDLPNKVSYKRKEQKMILKEVEDYFKKNESILILLEQDIISAQDNIDQLNETLQNIKQLQILNLPFEYLRSTDKISIITGRVQNQRIDAIKKDLKKEIEGNYELFVKEIDSKTSLVVVVFFNEDYAKASLLLKKHGVYFINIPPINESDPLKYVENEIKLKQQKIIDSKNNISKLREKIFEEAVLLKEELTLLKEKNESLHFMKESERFFVLQGYVPKSYLEKVKEIKNISYDIKEVDYVPGNDEAIEDVPVKLTNPKWLKPFEMVTELYSPPKYKDLDPTFIVGPLFLIFAGFMLTDFFYGLGLFSLGYFIFSKYSRYDSSIKDISISLIFIGIFSMIFGILTGSYLGDLMNYLFGWDSASLAIWLDPLSEPLYFLIVSIIIALFHVNFGLVLGAIENLRKKDTKAFISKNLVWWLLQLSIVCFVFAGISPIISITAKILAGITLAIILFIEGPLGLLGMTGFMGDVISYSRLFALCLSTAGIAMTVNLLADLLWPLPYGLGIFAALLVFIVGHLFSFAMNSLGGFVHSIRLQFVEFFGKFYEGGGNKFEPFKEERIYSVMEGDEK
jgi:V/A-type H+/Na+-transporting ATPase subunit I